MTRLCWAKTMLRRSAGSEHRAVARPRCSSWRRRARPPACEVVARCSPASPRSGKLARLRLAQHAPRSCRWRRCGSGRRAPPPRGGWPWSRPPRRSSSPRARCARRGRCAAAAPPARAARGRSRGRGTSTVTLTERAQQEALQAPRVVQDPLLQAGDGGQALLAHEVPDAPPQRGMRVVAEVVAVVPEDPLEQQARPRGPPALGGRVAPAGGRGRRPAHGLNGTARPGAARAAARCPPAWRCSPRRRPRGTSRGRPSWPWR